MLTMNSPTRQWDLMDWFQAVKISNISEHVIRFQNVGEIYRSHQGKWTNNVFTWKTVGITNREDAVMMIAILNHYAKQNGTSVMSNQNLREHSTLFLRSSACKPNNHWPSLNLIEFEAICGASYGEEDVIGHVHPHPQRRDRFFGRDSDIQRLGQLLTDYSVVVVTGNGGDGKTALAWHTAQSVKNILSFQALDWLTDKQVILNPDTEELHPTHERGIGADFKSSIIQSLIKRFQHVDASWAKVLEATTEWDKQLKLCQELLVAGQFLLVIDGIETTGVHNEIVRFLLDLLTDSTAKTRSRALVTSRLPVMRHAFAKQAIYPLKGLEPKSALEFIQALQVDLESPLPIEDCVTLVEKTAGNPLFIQVVLGRYRLDPTRAGFNRILRDIDSGRARTFDFLFRPVVSRLNVKGASHLVRFMSDSPSQHVSRQNIEQAWQTISPKPHLTPDESESILGSALRELTYNGIVMVNPHEDAYTLHPLIRNYVKGRRLDES